MSIQSSLEQYNKLVKTKKPLELEVRLKKIRNKAIFENVYNLLLQYGFKRVSEKYYLKCIIQSKDELNNIRCEINDLFNIQNYCNHGILPENTIFIKKDKKHKQINEEYDLTNAISVESKIKDEKVIEKIYKQWGNMSKLYRLMNRISLQHDSMKELVVDMSIVKSKISNVFKDSNVVHSNEEYEIEIEMNEHENTIDVKKINEYFKKVIKYILCGKEESDFPISNSEKNQILSDYSSLFKSRNHNVFIGPSSYTLKKVNLVNDKNTREICVLNDFCMTDKADGLRKLLYISKQGKIYFITNTYPLNVQYIGTNTKEESLKEVLLDGEYIKYDKYGKLIHLFAAFDIYFAKKEDKVIDLRKQIFEIRYKYLIRIVEHLNENCEKLYSNSIDITFKEFYFITPEKDLFYNCKTLFEDIKSKPYNTDGIIFSTSKYGVTMEHDEDYVKNKKYTWKHSFKWKPPEFNSIDFKIKIPKNQEDKEKIETIYDADKKETKQYKLLYLYVGRGGYEEVIDTQMSILRQHYEKDKKDEKEILFIPNNPYDKDSYKCYVELSDNGKIYVEEEGPNGRETIENDAVVEFKYVNHSDKRLRWVPLRIRHDKTQGNAFVTANNNWNSIHNPIHEDMLTNPEHKLELLDVVDEDVYYNKKGNVSKTSALRDFHNKIVKTSLYKCVCEDNNSLIDFATGKAGDLHKWLSCKFQIVLGIDLSKDNIHNANDGACSRYLSIIKENSSKRKYIFMEGDSSKLIETNAIGNDNPISREIIEHFTGKVNHSIKYRGLPDFGSTQHGFDVGTIQFAIHYLFQDKYKLNGFLKNCADMIKQNGYLIGTCYDGETIFKMLKKDEMKELYIDDHKIWHIKKKYKSKRFLADETCLGYKISVFQDSINQEVDEYLVHFKYFISMMKKYGFEIPDNKKIKLFKHKPIDFFSALYDEKKHKTLSKEEQQISFLNKYFIFQKVNQIDSNLVYQHETSEQSEFTKESILHHSSLVKLRSEKITLN